MDELPQWFFFFRNVNKNKEICSICSVIISKSLIEIQSEIAQYWIFFCVCPIACINGGKSAYSQANSLSISIFQAIEWI